MSMRDMESDDPRVSPPIRPPHCRPAEEVHQAAMPMACRESARDVLQSRIAMLQAKIRGLEALDRCLPKELSHQDDEALWQLLCHIQY